MIVQFQHAQEKNIVFCVPAAKVFPVMVGERAIVIQSVEKISSQVLERLWKDEQFSIEANNLILESLSKVFRDGGPTIAIYPLSPMTELPKGSSKTLGKDFTNRSIEKNKMMDIKFPAFKKSFRGLQKESIDAFEKEFDERLALTIGREKTIRLKRDKRRHQLAFFRWIFSLCTIASLPYVDDDSTKSAGLLFP
ncbi:MAG: hypothetical protein LBF49_01380 [Puniceicoccales bacterium]|nr:hypothetical protein [Puniceicoccales bacterium]